MDSVSQIALGAAVSVAVMGRRTALGRAAFWGAVCGTLPDLDALIDHGDPVLNMTLHRGESHALFWLALVSPFIALGIAKLHGEMDRLRRWWLAVLLALVTHPLLDVMTVYGTRLGLPFSDEPYGVDSVFIIDPLYTLPLVIGTGLALLRRNGLRWNALGLVLSTLYLGWGVAAQALVRDTAERALAAQGLQFDALLVNPTAFNSLLWRVVAIEDGQSHEGYRSLLDGDAPLVFRSAPRRPDLYAALATHDPVARLAAFSDGFFEMQEHDGVVRIADLRMGQAPYYYFTFEVARREGNALVPTAARAAGGRVPIGNGLSWLLRRIGDPAAGFPG